MTTSVLASAVAEIGGDKIDVAVLVPPGSCPGHFDLKIQHVRLMESSGYLLAHGFEEYLDGIREAVSNPDFKIYTIEISNSWLVPEGQLDLYRQVSELLAVRMPDMAEYFDERMESLSLEIEAAGTKARDIVSLNNLHGAAVICNAHLKNFLEYAGFNVSGVYGRKEELTPRQVIRLLNLSRRVGISMVVDNIQAGQDTGMIFSAPLSIPHVAVSNFPGVFPDTDTLRETLVKNIERIVEAYGTAEKD